MVKLIPPKPKMERKNNNNKKKKKKKKKKKRNADTKGDCVCAGGFAISTLRAKP